MAQESNDVVLRGSIAQLSHVSASTSHDTEPFAQIYIKQEYVECDTEQNVNEKSHENCVVELRGSFAQFDHVSASTTHETDPIAKCDIKQESVDECTTEQIVSNSENFESDEGRVNEDQDEKQCVEKDSDDEYVETVPEILSKDPDGNKITDSSNFKEYMLIHTGEKKYECTICGKRLTRLDNLKAHIRIHTGERKYQCTICEKRFSNSDYLKAHIRTHTGERNYQCTVCEKMFAYASHLKAHIRIHTGERNFQCTVCDKKYVRSSHLKTHMESHGKRKHQCTVCKKRLTYAHNLKRHMRIHTT